MQNFPRGHEDACDWHPYHAGCLLLPTASLIHPYRRLGVCCSEDGEASA